MTDRSANEISDWLREHLARLLRCERTDIDVTATFGRLGLDSATAVGVTLDLEDWLGRPVEPNIFFEHPTIERLSNHLGSEPLTF